MIYDWLHNHGKTAARAAAAWERGYRGRPDPAPRGPKPVVTPAGGADGAPKPAPPPKPPWWIDED